MLTSRSLSRTLPTTSTSEPMARCTTTAVRRPSACTVWAEMLMPVLPWASSSAYLGTRSMSIKGDLPGLSNFCVGDMGSYQYSTLRSAAAPAWGTAPSATCVLLRHWDRPQPATTPMAISVRPARDFFRELFMVVRSVNRRSGCSGASSRRRAGLVDRSSAGASPAPGRARRARRSGRSWRPGSCSARAPLAPAPTAARWT